MTSAFKKQKLSFKDASVFGSGFKSDFNACYLKTAKLAFSKKINQDGFIDDSKAHLFSKSDLWSYIYYLYYYNNTDVNEFIYMKIQKTGRASAIMFYNVVKTVSTGESYDVNSNASARLNKIETILSKSLVKFINFIILEYTVGENSVQLINPIFDYFKEMRRLQEISMPVQEILPPKFKITTGNANSNSKIRQVSNNANIKITFTKALKD